MEMYIEDRALYDYAASTARLLPPTGSASPAQALRLLRQSMRSISRCRRLVERRCASLASPPPACQWLLDNGYLARREGLSALSDLQQGHKLRCCKDGLMILCLCRSLCEACAGKISEDRCRLFLDGFQAVRPLRRQELALFIPALKCALLEDLARCCEELCRRADTEKLTGHLEALFTSLRLFSVLDTEKLLTGADLSSAILAADPSGDYARMDLRSRNLYLERLEKLAARRGLEEHRMASELIRQAKQQGRHVGFLLFEEKKGWPAQLYIAAICTLSLIFSLAIALYFDSPAPALLLLLPLSELVKNALDFLLLRLIRPRPLPRMDLRRGVPAEGKSLCVVTALLCNGEEARSAAEKLERFLLASRSESGNLSFGLLADLPTAPEPETPADEAILAAAAAVVERLNRKYGGGFYLFSRPRRFDGESYSGHERKRGALLELAKLLDGQPVQLQTVGNRAALDGTRYIISLDSDTEIYPGSLQELIGAMLHPLNRPVIDEKKARVVSGHGLLHPRIATDLQSSHETDFALIFAGSGGSDPYGSLCGELYMDAFGSGGFAGKGILDIAAFLRCAGDRLPEGRILSHDALEGAYLRGGFVGDVEFCDRFPSQPLAWFKRLHRWTRGDWQNAPWIFHRELPPIERWRLLDSLRRSLIAPATLLALLLGFYLPHRAVVAAAAWAALLALLSRLLLSFAEDGLRRRNRVRLRRYTRLLTGTGASLVQSFLRLWLLPWEAWVCLSAACTALWRMLVSHRRLLQWQTAAQCGGGGFAGHIRAMLLPMLLGFVLLLSAPGILGRAVGLLWLLSPAAATALALPAKKSNPLSRSDREYLRRAAGESWQYLKQFSTAEENFLPPDNLQEQPSLGPAHRSSPTNIGFAMASAVAAADMEVESREGALSYLQAIVSTLERLPRCMGHFYNWYDTRSLRPLEPAFVSTVDSGNCYAALLVVRNALRQWGEETLARRLEELMRPMDFAPLYDESRGLFHICLDSRSGKGAGGWYDLMASEAMLTSYLAIAKGDVPRKHWRRLSRGQLQKDGFRGLASWTGTMFEYLMPELFLPFYPGSLLWESARFCVYAQRQHCYPGKPWGISESAFYALDSSLNYCYKAHGCPALALKRGQEADMVISPYSSFLALSVQPVSAIRNLRRLEQLGLRGRYGFYEAVDFTPERCRQSGGEPVRCYMAHHVGMSLLSAANLLCDGSIRRRFLAEPAMAAHSLLLQEQLPADPGVLQRDRSSTPERSSRSFTAPWQQRGEGPGEAQCLLSNGAYHILAGSGGESLSLLRELAVYRPGSFRLSCSCEGADYALIPAESPQGWELSEEQTVTDCEFDGFSCRCRLWAAAGDWGEGRSLRFQARRELTLQVRLCLQPLLARLSDFESHPAFWRLGLQADFANNSLLLRRLRRGNQPELWMALGFDRPFHCSETGALSGAPLCLSLSLPLRKGESRELRFALCLGKSRREALQGLGQILREEQRGCMVSAAAARLGMNRQQIGQAMALLPALTGPCPKEAAPRHALWPYGVSGDNPILCAALGEQEAPGLLDSFLLLKCCGMETDLVYLSDEQGEYHQPLRKALCDRLDRLGLPSLLGNRAGVHILPRQAAPAVESRAAFRAGREALKGRVLCFPPLSEPRQKGCVPEHGWEDREFVYYVNRTLPARSWQHILSDGSMGAIVRDTGPAALWLENAREMRLLPPPADIESTEGSEALWLELPQGPVSLFAANDGFGCRVRYGMGWACWEKQLGSRRVESLLFLAPGKKARVLLVRGAEGLGLHWAMKPTLAADSSSLICRVEGSSFFCENPESYLPGVSFLALTGGGSCRCDFRPAAVHFEQKAKELTVLVCGCGEAEELQSLLEPSAALAALEDSKRFWRERLQGFSLRSGFEELDRYLQPWAIYQSIACRLLGRSSLYQSGGAFGFRDQLQDSVNLMLLDTSYAREQILLCCRHQYEEGDVMHWWHSHPAGDKGLRSRCSDDLLWLVWALCWYTHASGDYALCALEEPFLHSRPLEDEEQDRYESPETGRRGSVLEHAAAALDLCLSRGTGPHGLPLFGSGDWNDGLDAVDGESVWLGWFLARCAGDFAALLDRLGDARAAHYRDRAQRLIRAAEGSWNGSFYRRGYWADGSPLGGENRLDSLPQSFAAFCPEADEEKVRAALKAALSRLVDREAGLVKLFDPPFSPEERYPGYISSYGEGFRENGGQYTHAAIWLAMACLHRGMEEEGLSLLRLLLPEGRDLSRYEAEPFVLAADIYSAPGRRGEAGWTWYTGSAAWYFQAVTESLLGLHLEEGRLRVRPHLPPSLPRFQVRFRDLQGREQQIVRDGGEIRINGEKFTQ